MNNTITKTRTVKIIAALIAVLFFGWFMTVYIMRSQAEESKVDVTINPASGKVPEEPVSFIIRPQKNGDKISGVDLRVKVENGLMISWDDITTLDSTGNELFTELISTVEGENGRYSATVLKKDSELPAGVIVKGTVACVDNNPITITVEDKNSQIVGPVDGVKYSFSNPASVQLLCGDEPSPSSPTSPPVPPGNEQVTATFDPDTCATGVGSACTYRLRIGSRDQQNKISGYHVKITYDKSVLKGINIQGPGNVTTNSQNVLGLLAQNTTAVTPTPGAITHLTPAPGTSISTTPPIAGLTVTPGTNVTQSPRDTTETCATTQDCVDKMCGPAIPPSRCPFECVVPSGQTTGTCQRMQVSGMPPNQPIPPKVTPPDGKQPSSCRTVGAYINSEAGEMDILYACTGSAQSLYSSFVNTIAFEGIAEGEGAITIKSIQVVGPQGNPEYSVFKGEGNYIIGSRKVGDIEVKMKLRLQGILKKPKTKDSIQVKVGIGDGGLKKPQYNTVEFKVDDNGIWHGTAKFDIEPNAYNSLDASRGYKILVKPEYHMQRKFCTANPKESYPGSEKCDKGEIMLKKGENEVDLSGVIQLVCDVPPGDQDGICNSKDQALFKSLIGKKDGESLKRGDVNFDGIVNAVDHSLMISAMSVRWDEQ